MLLLFLSISNRFFSLRVDSLVLTEFQLVFSAAFSICCAIIQSCVMNFKLKMHIIPLWSRIPFTVHRFKLYFALHYYKSIWTIHHFFIFPAVCFAVFCSPSNATVFMLPVFTWNLHFKGFFDTVFVVEALRRRNFVRFFRDSDQRNSFFTAAMHV